MSGDFRRSMTTVHSWAGVMFGSLLMVVFWMGSLSVFDREIDRWMMSDIEAPALNHDSLSQNVSLDSVLRPHIDELLAAGARQWGSSLPDERTPYFRFFYQRADGVFVSEKIDPHRGLPIGNEGRTGNETLGASGFFFPFHFRLNLNWKGLGHNLVGAAAMAMLLLLVSGVVVHRKIIAEFFLFRTDKSFQRNNLDLHNLSSVLALPFHFLITLSGLIVFMSIYVPDIGRLVYTDKSDAWGAFYAEAADTFRRPPSGRTGGLASLDAMRAKAEAHWRDEVGFIRLRHAGDANAVVEMGRQVGGELSWNIDKVYFDAGSGERLYATDIKPMMQLQRFFVGLHFAQFDHWPLRFLYFGSGLLSCVMIATGFFFWLATRRRRHERQAVAGFTAVEAVTVASTTGLLLATLGYLVSNRIYALTEVPTPRALFETGGFYAIWLLSLLHALGRPLAVACRQQLAAIVMAGLAAPLLHFLGGGSASTPGIGAEQTGVAGVNLGLLGIALMAWWARGRMSSAVRCEAQMPGVGA